MDDVFIEEQMIFSHLLRVEFDRGAPHHPISEIFYHVSMNLHAKVFNRRFQSLDDNRRLIIRIFSLRLGIHSNQIQILPHLFDKFIKIPTKIPSNWHVMLNLIQDIQLIKSNGIYFIERIEAGNILPVSFYNINDVIFCGITLDQDVCVVYSVLF